MSRTNLLMDGDRVIQEGGWQTLFTASPLLCPEPDEFWLSQRSGGNMAGYDDDFLLVSVGDYAFDGTRVPDYSFAKDTTVVYGKFILVNKRSGEHHIYASGIRNSQGLLIDPDGTIWSTDHGQGGGDELNLIVEGHNYGWPESTLSIGYEEEEWPYSEFQGRHNLHEKPVFGWAQAIAPTDLLKIGGDKFPHWSGDLIVATLADESLRRLRLDSDNRVIYDERIELGHRVRDLLTLPDGSIGMITDDMVFIVIEDGGAVFEPLDSLHQERYYALDGYNNFTVKN
jgi:glucose/arabinose dehydrogenase